MNHRGRKTLSCQGLAIQAADNISPSAIALDLQQLGLTMLERQRKLTVDYWLNDADTLPFEQLDFVPLGLLEQKKDQNGRNSDYAVTEKFDREDRFFDEVLRDGKKKSEKPRATVSHYRRIGGWKNYAIAENWVLDVGTYR